MNYSCAFVFRFELEVRYDGDCDDVLSGRYAQENLYAKQAGDLRRRHWDLLGLGRFVDGLPLRWENEAVLAKAFENGDRMAVVLWNDSGGPQDVRLEAPGWEAGSVDSTEGPLPALPESMEPQQLLVQVFRRRNA